MSGKVRRPGSGRTPGSYSFVMLSLAEIRTKVADENMKFPVGRRWAEQMQFEVASAPANVVMGRIDGTTIETKPEVRVRDYNSE